MAMYSKPVYVREFNNENKITCVQFSPFEWSQQLLAIGTEKSLIVAKVTLENELSTEASVHFDILKEFHHPSPVTAIAWSSATNVMGSPRVVRFASAGTDKKIYIYETNLDKTESVQEIVGHNDLINGLSFAPLEEDGKESLISVSDDCTCRIWSSVNGSLVKSISLASAGVAVRFNPADHSKFLIVEKSGLVRIFSTSRLTPITSADPADYGLSPCLDADWSLANPQQFVTLLGNRMATWNLSQLSSPQEADIVVSELAQKVKVHPTLDHYTAVLGLPGPVVQVFHSGGQVFTSEPLLAASDISWHFRAPLLALANDSKVKLWKILVK